MRSNWYCAFRSSPLLPSCWILKKSRNSISCSLQSSVVSSSSHIHSSNFSWDNVCKFSQTHQQHDLTSEASSTKSRFTIATRSQISKLVPMANPCTVAAASSTKPTITHVVFDMDGLLLDTEKFYTEVQEIILARFNKTFDWSLKARMMGMKAIEAARVFVEETGISDSLSAEEFLVEREDMLRTLFPSSELMPGASRLIQHLHANGIPICVATGSHKRHFELKTQRHGELFSLMHHVVLGDDPEVKKGKPSPDIFIAAAKRFEGGQVDSRKILVFEDAPSGVLAAKVAGMSVVMVPDPRLDSSFRENADQVVSSLLDFNPSEWGLPPFEKATN